MESVGALTTYYLWLQEIVRSNSGHAEILAKILQRIHLGERVSFLKYLAGENRLGTVDYMLEVRFENDVVLESNQFTPEEIVNCVPEERSFQALSEIYDGVKSLFSESIPSLLKQLGKLLKDTITSNLGVEEQPIYDGVEELFDTEGAAKLLGVKKCTIYRYVWAQKLFPISPGKNNRYRKSDLLKLYKFKSYKNPELEIELEAEYQRLKDLKRLKQ